MEEGPLSPGIWVASRKRQGKGFSTPPEPPVGKQPADSLILAQEDQFQFLVSRIVR